MSPTRKDICVLIPGTCVTIYPRDVGREQAGVRNGSPGDGQVSLDYSRAPE